MRTPRAPVTTFTSRQWLPPTWPLALLFILAVLLVAGPAQAQRPVWTPRYWYDQHGNFVLIGNTLAQGCNIETPSPIVGSVGRACGRNKFDDDSSADYFWTLASGPAGDEASADSTVTALTARSQARLQLPEGARVTYARLYWAATRSNSARRPPADRSPDQPDTSAVLSFQKEGALGAREIQGLIADVTFQQQSNANSDFQYQSSREVTRFVQMNGPGLYRVEDVDAIDLQNLLGPEFMFSAWWMVVFYELESEPMRHLKLYDGLDVVAGLDIEISLRGFYVPTWSKEAKLGVVAFDGDQPDEGDWLEFNGVRMQNSLNPANNFFNSTRSYQPVPATGSTGTPEAFLVSMPGDLPQLSGRPWSMSGLDLDVVDVTLAPGDTSARVKIGTAGDVFWMGGFVTSISTQRPDFRETYKTVVNRTRTDGTTRPGDTLRYTITTKNTGDDASVGTKFVDALPAQLKYVARSIQVNGRFVTDDAGDDIGWWDADRNTLTVHLGRGATPDKGGEMGIGDSATVSFDAIVADSARGTIENVAIINAGGKLGADPMDTPSRPAPGQPSGPTPVPVELPPGDGGTDPVPDGGTDPDAGTDGCTDAGTGPDAWTPDDSSHYVVAGRGCSASGGSPLVWLAVLLFAGALMRSRRSGSSIRKGSAAAGLMALGALYAPAARAQVLAPSALSQSIDVQRYKPGPGSTDLLGVYGARVDRHLGWHLGASLGYANNPLGFLDVRQNDFVYQVVATQVTLDLMGSVSLFDRFELGVALPITYQASEQGAAVTPAFAEGVTGAGVGDLRLVPKAHLFSSGRLHLGVAVPVLLPTAGGKGFRGGAGVAVQPQVVGEWSTGSGLRVVANLGAHLRSAEQLSNLRAGHELSYALGARIPVGERLAVQAQLSGALGLAERDAEELPLELLASVQYRVRDGLLAHVGGGPGLTRGYGTPSFRIFAGIDWTQPGERAPAPSSPPANTSTDADGDRIPDARDACPSQEESRNGFQDEDGCPDEASPTRTDDDRVTDGPDLDEDHDGVPIPADECPMEPEVINGVKDEDGCPDEGSSKVRLESKRIVILDKVHFATAQDVILPSSFDLLMQVAAVLKAYPKIALLHVEGHTDDRGDDASNMNLSQRRADNVRTFLITQGISGERLKSVGYGETRPMDTNQTEAGRENNRRVEFNIVEDAGTPGSGRSP